MLDEFEIVVKPNLLFAVGGVLFWPLLPMVRSEFRSPVGKAYRARTV